MRNIKELLQLVLFDINYLESGLCNLVGQLYCRNIITFDEVKLLKIYIYNHRPNNYHKKIGNLFYWKLGEKKPRIAWLKRQIKIN